MEWQNWSFWQTIFSGPQAHGPDDGCSALQVIAGGLGLATCRPFASAKPTDIAIARKAIAKVFSIVSSSLDETGGSGPCNLMRRTAPLVASFATGLFSHETDKTHNAASRYPLVCRGTARLQHGAQAHVGCCEKGRRGLERGCMIAGSVRTPP